MENVTKILNEMANKLGVAAEFLWTTLVRQQITEGVAELIVAGILLTITIVCATVISRLIKKWKVRRNELRDKRTSSFRYDNEYNDLFEKIEFWTVGGWVAGVCGLIFGVVFLIVGLFNVLNPDYYALREIMNMIGRM